MLRTSPTPSASTITKAITQVASAVEIVTSAPADIVGPPLAETALPVPCSSAAASEAAGPAVQDGEAAHNERTRRASCRQCSHLNRNRAADTADGDRKIAQVRAIGPCQLGSAAWYGGRYIGRRTSSGTRLDQIHATAAHRTLPLNSLVRVTNLSNGRSVVVRITDRGPVSKSLLIDMSPKAADELAMKTAGIVPVSIEQVVEVSDASK